MKKSAVFLVAFLLWLGAQSDAQAQVAYVSCCRPITVYSPPVTVASVVVAPHTVYYAPASVAYAPVAYRPVTRVRTRYRPILGGTVTRVRYGYAPMYYPPTPVVYAY